MKKIVYAAMTSLFLAGCAADNQAPNVTKPESNSPIKKIEHVVVIPEGATGLLARLDVQRFIHEQVATGEFSRAELEAFFGNVQHKQGIINAMDKPGTSRPWYEFKKNNVGGSRISGGNKFWAQNVATLEAVQNRYGVPAEVITAIIGIETHYGSNMGSFRLGDSLTTLAFNYPRRAEFFQGELREFLKIAHEEKRDLLSFKGSYAGAMGMPQFMPSSYRKWAVDFDGNGQRDIWNSVPDAAASVANYLKQHGWQTDKPIMVPAKVTMSSELQALIDGKTELKYTVKQLRAMGVEPVTAMNDHDKAFLFSLEVAPGEYEYYLGTSNFYSIWKYNNSRQYVSAVKAIADGVRYGVK